MALNWSTRAVTADEAVAAVASRMRVFVHGAAATPTPLIEALTRRSGLCDVTLLHMHTEGPAPIAAPGHADFRGELRREHAETRHSVMADP